MTSKILLTAVILGALIAFTLTVAADESTVQCGSRITQNTILSADMNCDATGLTIANGVVLDCAGYTITYAKAGSGSGVAGTGATGTTIKNCKIVQGSEAANGYAIDLQSSSQNTVTDNEITTRGSGSHSMRLLYGASNNNINGNTISTRGLDAYGISIESGSLNNAVDGNSITTSGENSIGIRVSASTGNAFTSNTVSTSAANAYGFAFGSASDNIISRNTITTAATAIWFEAGIEASNQVSDNTINSLAASVLNETETDEIEIDGVTFPVADLGNCASEAECKTYCEAPANMEACLNFAEEHELMTPAEIDEARKVLPYLLAGTTPGQCRTREACEAYCSEDSHFEECISFAEHAGFVSAEDAEIARKVGGKGPGDCRGKAQCETYCHDEAHINECISFAQQHGLINEKEAEIARKVGLTGGPGGCRSETTCKAYCETPAHAEECINFAVQNGLIDPAEAEMAKKFMAAGGKGPGGCTGKDQCEAYCKDESHMTECIEFAHQIGAISEENYQRVKQFGGIPRPGGCSSEAECQAYCQDPAHLAECTALARSAGIEVPQGAGGEFSGAAAACQQQGIPLDQCQTYCQSNPAACGISTGGQGGPEGYQCPEGQQCQPPEGYQYPEGQQPPEGQAAPTGESGESAPSEPAPSEPAPAPVSGAVTAIINGLRSLLGTAS